MVQLQQVFCEAEEISICNGGAVSSYACGSEQFNEICAKWSALLSNSIVMPAFGVSINEYTVQAMQKGVWVEFAFAKQYTIDEMPFEKLLVEVRPEFMGFNVARYTKEYGYAGRCFYIDLRGNDMHDFYSFLVK